MKIRFIKPLRFLFKYVVPFLFLCVLTAKMLASSSLDLLDAAFESYLDISYKILLSAIVGYYTNFLAIKMLFKPKDKSSHGIQGLIPANQDQIAEKLGDGISENFFNAKDLIEYVNKNDIIAESVSDLKKYVEDNLEDEKNQKAITNWIINNFQSNSPKLFYLLLQLSEINLSKYLREKINLTELVKDITLLIEKNIDDGTINLKAISKKLTKFIQNNIPELSEAIYKQVNKEIEKQSTIKRALLKLATWTVDFDQDMIEDYLFGMVSSPEFRQKIYKNLENLVKRLTEYLYSEAGMKNMNIYYQKAIFELNDKIKCKGVPFILLEIEKFLQKGESWLKIEKQIKNGLNFIEKTLKDVIAHEKFDSFLTRSMPKALDKIKVNSIVTEKVKAYDTSKLEKMVLDASGEHLSAIEVLGGILGGFAGIALFDPLLFLYILGTLLGIGGVEYLLTKRQQNKKSN